MAERNVLLKSLKHPFLVGLHYSFQTSEKLYFVLDYVNGGEVRGEIAEISCWCPHKARVGLLLFEPLLQLQRINITVDVIVIRVFRPSVLLVWQLFYHLQREQNFGEPRARFYTAEVASAIGYLHSLNIVYRSAPLLIGHSHQSNNANRSLIINIPISIILTFEDALWLNKKWPLWHCLTVNLHFFFLQRPQARKHLIGLGGS